MPSRPPAILWLALTLAGCAHGRAAVEDDDDDDDEEVEAPRPRPTRNQFAEAWVIAGDPPPLAAVPPVTEIPPPDCRFDSPEATDPRCDEVRRACVRSDSDRCFTELYPPCPEGAPDPLNANCLPRYRKYEDPEYCSQRGVACNPPPPPR